MALVKRKRKAPAKKAVVAKAVEVSEVVEVSEAVGVKQETTPSAVVKAREGNFDFMITAKLIPKKITCDGYGGAKMGVHRYNDGCHSNLSYSIPQILAHTAGHGGGFALQVGLGRGAWKGWKDLSEVEDVVIADFRCGICEHPIPKDAGAVIEHMQPHQNTHRRIERGGKFLITLKRVDTKAPIFVDPEEELGDIELIDI